MQYHDYRVAQLVFPYGYGWDGKVEKYVQFENEQVEQIDVEMTFSELLSTFETERKLDLVAIIPMKVDPLGQSRFELILRMKEPLEMNENGDLSVVEE